MLDPKALVGVIAPLSNYLLTVSQPVSQTDHYLMKAFLRMVLFFNSEVSLLLCPHTRSSPTPKPCSRSSHRTSPSSPATSPT